MEVITGINLSRKFKRISEYKMDLGLAVKIDDSGKKGNYGQGGGVVWKIKDNVIKKYYENYGRYLNRTGKIGTLLFYTDNSIKNNDIHIIYDNEVYYSQYQNGDIRSFLSELISNVINGKLKPHEEISEKEEEFIDIKNMSNEELAEYLLKNRD